MTDVAAAVGRVQLRSLPQRTAARRANAHWLSSHLESVTTPTAADGATHVYHQYVIRADDREALIARLDRADIATAIHYPIPVHRTPAYLTDGAEPLPNTEIATQQVLSLPVHPTVSPADLHRIAAAANEP